MIQHTKSQFGVYFSHGAKAKPKLVHECDTLRQAQDYIRNNYEIDSGGIGNNGLEIVDSGGIVRDFYFVK